jgi:glutaminyl-peptide cyclotransferase
MRPLMAIALILAAGLGIYTYNANRDTEPERIPLPPLAGTEESSPFDKLPPVAIAQEGTPKLAEFDGRQAMRYLGDVCAIGPRITGTEGMRKQQDLLKKHFEDLKLQVKFQTFTGKQVSVGKSMEMQNLIVSFQPDKKKRAILCSHYDTRPLADQEPDRRKWKEPFVSANDGGSGVAFLMEFARHLPKLDLEVGVDLVFFDAEEFIFDRDVDRYFLGSQHFAVSWRKLGKDRPDYLGAVLLDMIAGKRPRFPVEQHSFRGAKALTMQLWQIAKQQGCDAFLQEHGDTVLDDHLALINAGIPAVDIIDFRYPHWHRLSDTPENCSPDGMIQVSKVLSAWLQSLR